MATFLGDPDLPYDVDFDLLHDARTRSRDWRGQGTTHVLWAPAEHTGFIARLMVLELKSI